jgi:hypothetical protein
MQGPSKFLSTPKSSKIWYRDFKSFVAWDHLWEFIPLPAMTLTQKLNAVMRFSIYATITMLVLRNDLKVLYVALLSVGFTVAMNTFYESEKMEFYTKHRTQDLMVDPHTKKACALPTKNNPFANILVSDFAINPTRKPGCDITKPRMKRMTENLFRHNLYKDIDDIWGRKTTSRNFYQTPIQTIPNQQGDFATWLYGQGGRRSCKEGDGVSCMRNQF